MLEPTLACITTQKKWSRLLHQIRNQGTRRISRHCSELNGPVGHLYFYILDWPPWELSKIVHQLKTFTPPAASNWSNGKQKNNKVNCPQWQPHLGPIITSNKIPTSHLKVRVVWNSVVICVRPQKNIHTWYHSEISSRGIRTHPPIYILSLRSS